MSVSCLVCQEAINLYSEEISVLNCGHLYHKCCLQIWMDDNLTCPECKSAITAENFVQKLYPFKPKNSNIIYKELCDDTKNMLKVSSTNNSENTLSKRNLTLERINSKLEKDFKKCLEENNAFKQENLHLKLEIEHLKNADKKVNDLEAQSNEVKTNSIFKRSFHSEDYKLNNEEICLSL